MRQCITTRIATVLLLSILPTVASNAHAENGKSPSKHNFETWQTIKKLQIDN